MVELFEVFKIKPQRGDSSIHIHSIVLKTKKPHCTKHNEVFCIQYKLLVL